MCSEEWNKVSGKNITPISRQNWTQVVVTTASSFSFEGTRIAFTGDASERYLGT